MLLITTASVHVLVHREDRSPLQEALRGETTVSLGRTRHKIHRCLWRSSSMLCGSLPVQPSDGHRGGRVCEWRFRSGHARRILIRRPFPTTAARLPIARHLGKALYVGPTVFAAFLRSSTWPPQRITTFYDALRCQLIPRQEQCHSVGVNSVEKND